MPVIVDAFARHERVEDRLHCVVDIEPTIVRQADVHADVTRDTMISAHSSPDDLDGRLLPGLVGLGFDADGWFSLPRHSHEEVVRARRHGEFDSKAHGVALSALVRASRARTRASHRCPRGALR